jgi:hypothetical protein
MPDKDKSEAKFKNHKSQNTNPKKFPKNTINKIPKLFEIFEIVAS